MFFPSPAYRPGVKNACWEVSQTLCILEGFTLLEKRKGSGAMAERKRAIQLKFYVTEQERILIEEKMKLLQTDNLGAYLRKMAIDGYIIQLDYSAIKEQTAEIQKVGVNVNQIAKRVNLVLRQEKVPVKLRFLY